LNGTKYHANKVYKGKGWIDWPDFLVTQNTATFKTKFRPFEEAKWFVRTLELKNIEDYRKYARSGKRPADIPSDPNYSTKTVVGLIGLPRYSK
jgi:hypothetical protein